MLLPLLHPSHTYSSTLSHQSPPPLSHVPLSHLLQVCELLRVLGYVSPFSVRLIWSRSEVESALLNYLHAATTAAGTTAVHAFITTTSNGTTPYFSAATGSNSVNFLLLLLFLLIFFFLLLIFLFLPLFLHNL